MSLQMKFNINNRFITVEWNNEENFLDVAFRQRPLLINKREYEINYNINAVYQHTLDRIVMSGLLTKLKRHSRILDIGSGVGVIASVLAKYLDAPLIWLLDSDCEYINNPLLKSSSHTVKEYRSKNNTHGFYNSWSPMLDSIKTNKLNKDSIFFLKPGDEFPIDLDLIISTYSWCWHYPKNVYWNQVKSAMKPSAGLFLTVSNWEEYDFKKEITQELNCEPIIFNERMPKKHFDSSQWIVDDLGNRGYTCYWENNIGKPVCKL